VESVSQSREHAEKAPVFIGVVRERRD
jgi:hypothetical protein